MENTGKQSLAFGQLFQSFYTCVCLQTHESRAERMKNVAQLIIDFCLEEIILIYKWSV